MMQGFGGSSELEHLVEGLGYEQYLFDDSGFYRARSNEVLNTDASTRRNSHPIHSQRQVIYLFSPRRDSVFASPERIAAAATGTTRQLPSGLVGNCFVSEK